MDSEKDKYIGLNNSQIDNNQLSTTFFKNDTKYHFLYKKTERLLSALYLVTNTFSDTEPVRVSIREKAMCLLDYALLKNDSDYLAYSAVLIKVGSILKIAFDAGFVSEMNYLILANEISSLSKAFEGLQDQKRKKTYFNESFFSVPSLPKQEISKDETTLKDMSFIRSNNVLYNVPDKNISQNINDTKTKNTDSKNDRRKKIFEIVNKKSVCTIKDFSYVITDYSEKTIQRELGAMVLEGVLKKDGEKRWSTYSLPLSITSQNL